MLLVVFWLFVALIAIGVLIACARFLLMASLALLGVAVAVLTGPAFAVGFAVQAVLKPLRMRALATGVLAMTALFLALVISFAPSGGDGSYEHAAWKYWFAGALCVVGFFSRIVLWNAEGQSQVRRLFAKAHTEFYTVFYGCFGLLLIAAIGPLVAVSTSGAAGYSAAIEWGYWLAACLGLSLIAVRSFSRASILKGSENALDEATSTATSMVLGQLKADVPLDDSEVEQIFAAVVAKRVMNDELVEVDLQRDTWLFRNAWFNQAAVALDERLGSTDRVAKHRAEMIVAEVLKLPASQAEDYALRHLSRGTYYEFADGTYFVHAQVMKEVNVCACCGVAEFTDTVTGGEWFCSSICEETEKACAADAAKEVATAIGTIAAQTVSQIEGGQIWNEHHRVFGQSETSHGFAAERANHMLDRLRGRDANVLGDDCAKNGADRLVDGEFIQTKYCNSARSSVNKAFVGDNGPYRYMKDGRPMELEVPRDQYERAIKVMEKRIEKGHVPGVSDPQDARKLVRKGHVTYEQARNVTKFGRWEGLAFDARDGVITGMKAGGISFALTASIYYVRTGDRSMALRTAAIGAAKSFGTSFAVHVGTQQLHRVAAVQKALLVIDVKHFSPSVRNVLERGWNVQGKSQLNKVLRGNIVTSFVIIGITVGPDAIKVVRGRISSAQFFKRLTVVASSVAGGTAGAVIGGAIGSTMGPAGTVAGQVAGGVVGGFVASKVATWVTDRLAPDDAEAMIKIVQAQLEYLALSFLLTEAELDSVNERLSQKLTADSLEMIYAAGYRRRATANRLLKPIVVDVVKHRPALTYTPHDVLGACKKLAA